MINSFKSNLPLVSVVLATYNGKKFISEQIESILNQSYQNIELIIQDDGSSDDTVQIIKKFENKLNISLEINPLRLGFVKNFEKGLLRARGEFIALCDQDDIWHKNKLTLLLAGLSNAELVHSNCELIDENGKKTNLLWKKDKISLINLENLIFRNYITGCTVLFKRKLLLKAIPFPDNLAYHDWWLSVCAMNGNGISYINLPLVSYRQHFSQNTGSKSTSFFQSIMLRFTKNFVEQRKDASLKQLKNLEAAKSFFLEYDSKNIIEDAIEYHRILINRKLSLSFLLIGIRNRKRIRPFSRFPLINFILNDCL